MFNLVHPVYMVLPLNGERVPFMHGHSSVPSRGTLLVCQDHAGKFTTCRDEYDSASASRKLKDFL